MAGPRAVPVRMTIKRERRLRQVTAAGTSPQRLVLRARIILAAADGDPNEKIARDLGCSVNTVRKWRKRFAVRGIPGIFDRPRPGGRRPTGPACGCSSSRPRRRSRRTESPAGHKTRSPAVCANAAWRYPGPPSGGPCADAKVRPHKVRGWLNRRDDPAFWAQAGAVCRLYLHPEPGTVLISIDEKPGIQAKTRRYPDLPARPGRDARREWEYRRHGTVSIVAAMNVATGEVMRGTVTRMAGPRSTSDPFSDPLASVES